MPNNQNNQPTPQDNEQLFQSPSLNRFIKDLGDINIDDKAAGFLAGKLTRVVVETTAIKAQQLMGEEGTKKFEAIKDTKERQEKMEQIFQEKEGKSVAQFQEELMEKLVQDFEGKGEIKAAEK